MDKELKDRLQSLFDIVMEEIETNNTFATKIESILKPDVSEKDGMDDRDEGSFGPISKNTEHKSTPGRPRKKNIAINISTTRGSNRRDKAVLDPIKLTEEGDTELKAKLEELTEKQLKDIIADYGMDTSKLAMKWKDRNKLIHLILETSARRATKGDAFRDTD